jgi:putative transposase
MARSKTGEAISAKRRSRTSRRTLMRFIERAKKAGRLDEWLRGRAVLGYIEGKKVVDLAATLDVGRSSVNRWLHWYELQGIPGIRTRLPPGVASRLSAEQQAELVTLIDAGPVAAGYSSGVWTGPIIADLIEARFGYRYHNHSVPALLHKLGFSVQRPRKRLTRRPRRAGVLAAQAPARGKKRPPPAAES